MIQVLFFSLSLLLLIGRPGKITAQEMDIDKAIERHRKGELIVKAAPGAEERKNQPKR